MSYTLQKRVVAQNSKSEKKESTEHIIKGMDMLFKLLVYSVKVRSDYR